MTAHPTGWPNTDATHRIIRHDGDARCAFCDCRPSGKTAGAPCEFAPKEWRARLASGETWIAIQRSPS